MNLTYTWIRCQYTIFYLCPTKNEILNSPHQRVEFIISFFDQRRKTDLEDRLYRTYDKMDDMESMLTEAKAKRRSVLAEKISGENIYKALIFFDQLYEKMSETEKRAFYEKLLYAVYVYEERQPNGQWIKSIEFKLPIIEHDMKLSLDNDNSVETVALLSKLST